MPAPKSPSLWTTEARVTLALALPLIMANLAQSVIHATDLIFLGRLGADELAAASLAINLFMPFILFGLGLIAAVSPMVAAERGRKLHSVRDVRRTVRQGMWLAVLLCIPCWLILWQADPILRAMGQDAQLSRDAASFLHVLMWGLLPAFLQLALRNFVAAIERPGWATAVLFGAVFINAALGWALIFGHFGMPKMGLTGAALASALANLFLFLALAAVVLTVHPFRRYAIFGRFWRADWERFRALAGLGLPIAITLTFEVTVFAAAVFLMGLIDRASIAAHAIALQIAAFSFMVPMGIAQAATVRVGLAYGARDHAAIHRAGWLAFAMGVGFMACMALTLILIPRPLVGIFIDLANPENADVVALAVSFLGVAALFQIVDGAQVVGAGVLRGLQDTRWPMIFAAIGYWIVGMGIAVLLAFTMQMRGLGVWLGLASGLAFVAVLMLMRWMRRGRLGLLP
jgi:multidrug resistance protein, MATE family